MGHQVNEERAGQRWEGSSRGTQLCAVQWTAAVLAPFLTVSLQPQSVKAGRNFESHFNPFTPHALPSTSLCIPPAPGDLAPFPSWSAINSQNSPSCPFPLGPTLLYKLSEMGR